MTKQTIALYTMSWNGYWDQHGKRWSESINNLNTIPDEVIVVSDQELDLSDIKIGANARCIIGTPADGESPTSYYRNLAVSSAMSDWIVCSDLDDVPFQNYLDDLDDSSDIHGFSFVENGMRYVPDSNSLYDRLHHRFGTNGIPGTSAVKKSFFEKIRYENDCHEDLVFYSMAYYLNPKVAFDEKIRFEYSGFHSNSDKLRDTSLIYKDMLLGTGRAIFVCWFSNTITDSRKKALAALARSCNVNVKLITNKTFYDYENSEIPIHKGFKFLSDIGKADYARAYLMYFYGGGYSDIKANTFDWNPYFDQLLASKYDAIGYAEQGGETVGNFWDDDLGLRDRVFSRYSDFPGNGHFIFKPRTRFAYDWIQAVHSAIDKKYSQLRDNPGLHPYAVTGGIHESYAGYVPPELISKDYPFIWGEIGGKIRQKLEYEYDLAVFKKGMPFTNMIGYR